MADSALQQQLDEVRALLGRARELFGANPSSRRPISHPIPTRQEVAALPSVRQPLIRAVAPAQFMASSFSMAAFRSCGVGTSATGVAGRHDLVANFQ